MRKVLVQKFFMVVMVLGLFVSCNNLSETEENLSNNDSPDSSQEVSQDSLPAESKKALLVVDGKAAESRTAFPKYDDVETALDVSFHLTGTLDKGPKKLIKSWEADETTPAYTKMTEDKNLLVDTGTWDFHLSVRKNNVEVLYAELLSKQIKVGKNSLRFVLEEAPSGKGDLSYTLIFPSAGVAKVRASLLDLNDATTEEPQDLPISPHDTSNNKSSVTYTLSNVPAGNYMVKLEIFSDNDKTDQLGGWTEVARIAPGFTTEATRTMKYLTYTVTFNENGGTGDMEKHKFVYGIEKKLPVNTFTRTGYTFGSWNTKKDGKGKKYEDGADIDNGSVTLYAQWEYKEPETQGGVYQVANAGNLLWISEALRDGTIKKFDLKLTANIEIPKDEWEPIYLPNSGGATFDGQGYSITFNESNGSGGLFDQFNYSTVKNLVLKGTLTVENNEWVGALGEDIFASRIENVMSEVNITNTGTGHTGGLVGLFGGNSGNHKAIITNCAVYGDVTGNGNTGGLVGALWSGGQTAQILNSVYMGTVNGNPKGAIVGKNQNNRPYASTLKDIFYCDKSGNAHLGDGLPLSTTNNVRKKTEEEIKTGALGILGNKWELKAGAEYPTLKSPPLTP